MFDLGGNTICLQCVYLVCVLCQRVVQFQTAVVAAAHFFPMWIETQHSPVWEHSTETILDLAERCRAQWTNDNQPKRMLRGPRRYNKNIPQCCACWMHETYEINERKRNTSYKRRLCCCVSYTPLFWYRSNRASKLHCCTVYATCACACLYIVEWIESTQCKCLTFPNKSKAKQKKKNGCDVWMLIWILSCNFFLNFSWRM